MWCVLMNNFIGMGGVMVSGWSVVSMCTNEIDALNQMQIYITNNAVDPDDLKVVFNEEV